jgi:NADH-quinone oxidoreductase subunit M
MSQHLLSLIIFSPLIAALILLFVPKEKVTIIKYLALITSVFQVIIAGLIYLAFQKGSKAPAGINKEAGFQLIEKIDWISMDLGRMGRLSIEYFVAVDGLSVTMVLLSAFILLIGVISSWNLENKLKGYFFLYLLLNASIMGCFVALDFFLFYLFFEFMLLPMYFLIGIWGGPRREYAAIKFFLYTLAGSIFILIVIIGLYISVIDPAKTAVNIGLVESIDRVDAATISKVQLMLNTGKIAPEHFVHTFNIIAMTDTSNFIPGSFLSTIGGSWLWGQSARLIAFLALFIGFAIKLPAVPFHTWLPDAHVEAPTPISVILAGILLKVGAYGLMRIPYSIFPEGAVHYAWWIGLFGIIAIIYGAFNALAMSDLKKLIAYSSISHMGFVLLGLASVTSEGVSGALYQMFSHGIISPMLFLVAGVIYDRTHNRDIPSYRGLASRMPYYTVVVVIAFFASLGLPGFSGFISEILVFLGAFNSASVNELIPRWMAIVATIGLLLTAGYYLWTLQRMFFGSFSVKKPEWATAFKDLDTREYLMFIPLIIATIIFGIFPHIFLDMVNQSVSHFVSFVSKVGHQNMIEIIRNSR